jgi:hypothetical protein
MTDDLEHFRERDHAELGEPPLGYGLERIDTNGHYEPSNVRWATPLEQQNNKRTNVTLTVFGRTQTVTQWAREYSINASTLMIRILSGWHIDKALVTPPRGKKRGGSR